MKLHTISQYERNDEGWKTQIKKFCKNFLANLIITSKEKVINKPFPHFFPDSQGQFLMEFQFSLIFQQINMAISAASLASTHQSKKLNLSKNPPRIGPHCPTNLVKHDVDMENILIEKEDYTHNIIHYVIICEKNNIYGGQFYTC